MIILLQITQLANESQNSGSQTSATDINTILSLSNWMQLKKMESMVV